MLHCTKEIEMVPRITSGEGRGESTFQLLIPFMQSVAENFVSFCHDFIWGIHFGYSMVPVHYAYAEP